MHDPATQAFKINFPWGHRGFGNQFYWEPFITIWHIDPCTDGTDDSCGWFMRARYGDKTMLENIKKDFAFDWDADWGGWFNKKWAFGAETGQRIACFVLAFLMICKCLLFVKFAPYQRGKFLNQILYRHSLSPLICRYYLFESVSIRLLCNAAVSSQRIVCRFR